MKSIALTISHLLNTGDILMLKVVNSTPHSLPRSTHCIDHGSCTHSVMSSWWPTCPWLRLWIRIGWCLTLDCVQTMRDASGLASGAPSLFVIIVINTIWFSKKSQDCIKVLIICAHTHTHNKKVWRFHRLKNFALFLQRPRLNSLF